MSGTVSYEIAELRHLNDKEYTFWWSYGDLMSGIDMVPYSIKKIHEELTGVVLQDRSKMFDNVMNISTNADIDFINEEVATGRAKLAVMMQDDTYRHYVSIRTQHMLLSRITDSMNKGLPDDILESMLLYMRSISNDESLSKELINDTFLSVKFDESPGNPAHIFESMRLIMDDQIAHFDSKETNCQIWHIEGRHGDYPLGSVCLFYNANKPMIFEGGYGAMIQDIVKYPIPFLVQFLFPSYNIFIPKLNTVLETPINITAAHIGVDYIFVKPIGNQGDILTKYYGYKQTTAKPAYPCSTISPGFGWWLYKEVYKGYL